jgi:hypothetical protein
MLSLVASPCPVSRRRAGARLPALLLAALAAPAAFAHDSWLAVRAEQDPAAETLRLQFTTGDAYPQPDGGVAVTRVARAELLLDGRRRPLQLGLPAPQALPLRAAWDDAAAALALMSLHPRDLELERPAVNQVLAELGDDPAIAARAASLPRWRERFRKHAKLIVRRADGPPLAEATQAQGLPYELVPQQDPSLLPAGAPLRVCAMADGAPVGPVYLGLVEADGRASAQWSGPDGCATVQPQGSGYLLRSIRLQPARLPGLEWESDFAALTVQRLSAVDP